MLVPNISLQQQEGCCCHSNCFQTWQLFLPSPTNPSPFPQLILRFCVSFSLFLSFFFFLPFFFFLFLNKWWNTKGWRLHQEPPAACPWTTQGCCHCTGNRTSVMVTSDLQPVSPLSLGQSKILQQQFLQAVSGKSSSFGGRLVCRECCNS